MTDLACQQLVELVTAYLDDVLTAADRLHVEEHLAACGNCDAYLAQMRATIALARDTWYADPRPDDALPAGMLAELLAEFRYRPAPGSDR